MSLSFTWINVFIFILVISVFVALALFKKITAPIRIVLSIFSLAAFLYFLWATGLARFGFEKVLFMGQAAADLFSGLANILVGRVLG
ncbi:MAG: hypothetical protein V1820_05335 [archaeon]